MIRLQTVGVMLLWVSISVSTSAQVGVVQTQPSEGRFVKTNSGYMVPYKATIPGTEVTFEMVPVPGGRLRLGSPPDEDGRQAHEGPQLEIGFRPFWIGRYEVTWGEYHEYYDLNDVFNKFKRAGVRPVTAENEVDAVTAPSIIYDPSGRMPAVRDKRTKPNYPAVSMTQYAAKQYTKWLSKLTGEFYRLPTEAEWEYACRAGTTTAFHFGDDPRKLGQYAWYSDNSGEVTQPVGLKKPNAWGLYDMHGNAGEWVLDQFDEKGYDASRTMWDGAEPLLWPTKLHPRVVRGGSWYADPTQCRSAARLGSSDAWQEFDPDIPQSPWWLAADMHNEIGFRIVRPLASPDVSVRSRYWDADFKQLREGIQDKLDSSGRGSIGVVDPALPEAIKRFAEDT